MLRWSARPRSFASHVILIAGLCLQVPLVILALLTAQRCTRLWALVLHPVRSLKQATDGPGLFRGRLVGSTTSRSPQGHPALAWVADVSYFAFDPAEGRSLWKTCTLGDLPELTLQDGESRLRFAVKATREAGPTPSAMDWLGSLLPQQGVASAVPEAVRSHCNLTSSFMVRYREAILAPDQQVTVVGCREKEWLLGCGDGADMVLLDGFSDVIAAATAEDYFPFMILIALLVVIFALGPLKGCASRTQLLRRISSEVRTQSAGQRSR